MRTLFALIIWLAVNPVLVLSDEKSERLRKEYFSVITEIAVPILFQLAKGAVDFIGAAIFLNDVVQIFADGLPGENGESLLPAIICA